MIVLLDTSILLRLVDRADAQHSPVRAAVRAIKARGDTLTMMSQNVAEFWNVCTRPSTARGGLGLSIDETNVRLRVLERIVRRLPDSDAVYAIWRNLVVSLNISGVKVHDARIAAQMISQGITHIMSFNVADFVRYPGITAIDPSSVNAPTP